MTGKKKNGSGEHDAGAPGAGGAGGGEPPDENKLIAERRVKLAQLRSCRRPSGSAAPSGSRSTRRACTSAAA
jgi:hypothetical protein